jgi:drug/metabolite transporter (DMT)-like permease
LSDWGLAAGLMLASGSFHAVVNAIVKAGRSKMAARAATDGTSAIVLFPALLLVPLPAGAWTWLALSGAIHAVYLVALVNAYERADFSAAYPVLRGVAPLITALVTIGWLGEHATPAQVAGIALLGGGMVSLAIGRHLDRGALGWALLSGSCTAAYTVVDAVGVRAAPTVASYIAWDFAIMGVLVVALFSVLSRGTLFADIRARWRPSAVAGILSIVTYGAALYAFSLGPTAPLAALRETGMVTALVIGFVFLKEPVTPRRAAAVTAILAGAALILWRGA